ncbi:MAG: hypothetical protein QOH65_1554 [Methylobacteriaceae bacterium]|jgi:hypothetical protein|nr:hypothetical protein [Methylobacteriaceae bacterium]
MDLSSIASTALTLSELSFAAFVILSIVDIVLKFAARGQAPPRSAALAAGVNPAQIFEAAAKLAEAMTKAGPALAALVASLVFLGIAAASVGGKQALDKVPTPPAQTTTK